MAQLDLLQKRILAPILWNFPKAKMIFAIINDDFEKLLPSQVYREVFKICKKYMERFGKVEMYSIIDDLINSGKLPQGVLATKIICEAMESRMTDEYGIFDIQELKKHLARHSIEEQLKIQTTGLEIDSEEFMELSKKLKETIEKAENEINIDTEEDAHSIKDQIMFEINDETKKECIYTRFTKFDQIKGGLLPGEMNIIAGRPGQGKTTFAMNICRNVAVFEKIPCLYISTEMSEKELTENLCSNISGIPVRKIRDGELTASEKDTVFLTLTNIENAPIHILHKNINFVSKVNMAVQKYKDEKGVKLVIIDHIQRINSDKKFKTLYELTTDVSRSIKDIAQNNEISIICLCQLNRRIENDANKLPNLSDLKQSGAIEEDASMVLFINKNKDEHETRFSILKNRTGNCRMFRMVFSGETLNFNETASGIVDL